MDGRRISTQALLYFLVMMFLVVTVGCSSRNEDASTATITTTTTGTYKQSDLAGTWVVHMLKAGTNGWAHANVTIDSAGALSFDSSYADSSAGTAPTVTMVWTVTTTGVISETHNGAATDFHYTMTSNKNFIAGTGTGGDGSSQFIIAQKKVDGTGYTNDDVLNISRFVYHQLGVGSSPEWRYGDGTTSSGAVNINSETDSSGATTTPGAVGTILMSSGVVTITGTGMTDYHGFLSDDKKTIVGTYTDGTDYKLMIIQITGTEFPTGALPAGTSFAHMLGSGAADGWVHSTITVASGGGITFGNWVSNNTLFTAPDTTKTPYTGNITTTSGTVTITGDTSYHGQLSHDKNFMVGTQTGGSGFTSVYMLNVTTQ
jgi:hypothetical protein